MSFPFTMKTSSEDVPNEDEIREKRVEVARRNPHWAEVEETALVRRGPFFVHSETDELFMRYRSVVFPQGSASAEFNDRMEMFFYIDRNRQVVFLERNSSPRTWSEVVAKRAQRELAKAAPKPRRSVA